MGISKPRLSSKGSAVIPDKRIKKLIDRSHLLAAEHRRDLLVDNPEFLVYHWSGEAEAFSPATGEQAAAEDARINCGDHNCRVDIGGEYPAKDEMPSKVGGYEMNELNWAKDYAFFLDHSPAEVLPNEEIVGEFHWQLDEARLFRYPADQRELGKKARELGAGGISFTHTCPDLSIGLKLGWPGLLAKIKRRRKDFLDHGNDKSATYLHASELVVESIIRFVSKHGEVAAVKARESVDGEDRDRYELVSNTCRAVASRAPKSYREAVQWIQFFLLSERLHGHGNGYGRLDMLLFDFYERDRKSGSITREEARNLVAEVYLKYGGNYWSFGGRDQNLKDYTNEMSWVCLEAYDMTGGYNHLGLMWHSDMDQQFFNYGCDVLGRHGAGTPTLVNYDLMRASQLRSGVSEEHAWNVSYSGCQWYCIVGREYNDQDLNSLVLVQPMQRAMEKCAEDRVGDFDEFFAVYDREVHETANILRDFKNATYLHQHNVWPEMVTSLCMHGCIEKGRDVTDMQAVDYNFTSVNVLGVPNVSDAMVAMKQLVFEQQKYTLAEVVRAVETDWDGLEVMRQEFLRAPKFGNDDDTADDMAIRVSEHVREVLESKRNIKGFWFRPSLFQFMGHTYAGPMMGATPDGRKAKEPLAHGMNPMHGRNEKGILTTAHSFCKLDFSRYQGGSLQVELDPSFFPGDSPRGKLVEVFGKTFFQMGGVQINLNVVDLEKLKKAMDNPEDPQFRDLVVKVTGYSAHFTVMDRKFQEEFVSRVNYQSI